MAESVDPAALVEFLRGLRQYRDFLSEPVPQHVVDDILTVARWSGSASNRQPWDLIVVQDRKTLQALAEAEGYAKHLATAALGIVIAMANEPEREMLEAWDEGRISERIMLAARAHGVGAGIGFFIEAGPGQVKELLGIPSEKTVRTALSLGYPDLQKHGERPKRDQARKPLSEIAHMERF